MKINAHTFSLELSDCIDADHAGSIITNAFAENKDALQHDTVNIIKVHLPEKMPAYEVSDIMESVQRVFRNLNAKNCIFIPCHPKYIKDIVVDKVEVIHTYDEQV